MNHETFDTSELDELIDAVRDEQMTAEQLARLEDILSQNEEARRYYLRAMRLQGYLEQNAVAISPVGPAPVAAPTPLAPPAPVPDRRIRNRIAIMATLATCLIVAAWLVGSVFWNGPQQVVDQPQQPANPRRAVPPDAVTPNAVALNPAWKIEPTGKAEFSIIDSTTVQLDRGELRVASLANSPTPKLLIKTPDGDVSASGTRFLVGYHRPTTKLKGIEPMFKSLTRVLVMAGVVTLTNALGNVQGNAGDLLAAEPDQAPTKLVVQANSDFAFDLYQQLAKENDGKNLFFSPYSVSGALAMTAEGARHETAAEMGAVLRFPDATKRIGDDAQRIPWETSLIHTGMSQLNRKLNDAGVDPAETAEIRAKIAELRKELKAVKANVAQLKAEKKWQEFWAAQNKEHAVATKLNAELAKVDQYEIRVANALWGEKTYPFDPNYTKTISQHYDTGGVFPVDFWNNFEEERLRINGWVEEQTNERIKDLMPEGSLTKYTRLVLTNAIYFKGDWSVPFKEENTKDSDFTLSGGDKQQTPIMHAPNLGVGRYGAFNADGSHFNTPMRIGRDQDPKGHYPKSDGFAIVELPYKGDDLSMVVIAPNDPAGLSAIEEKLTPDNLTQWVGQLKKRKTHVYLPKFKMETEYKLGDAEEPATLQKMGMVRAFKDPRDPKAGAQFKGMTTSTDPMKQLYITGVFHKAFVEVNEKGTEAAAATGVGMASPTSMPRDVPFTPEFKADRPFVFLIREKSTGSVLFLGRMMQPAMQ